MKRLSFIFFLFPLLSFTQTEDFQLWSSASINYSVNKKLEFKVVSTNFQMFKGPFGTLEPDSETLESKPELIFIPLLAFDKDFNRLGYGGGFYDRTIYQFKKKIFKVGIAFDNQITDNVPVNEFDQKLDAIVTPSRIILGNNYL